MTSFTPHFSTIAGSVAARIIAQDPQKLYDLVRDAYAAFGAKRAVNPHSTFLTFKEIDSSSPDRIIALPACIGAPEHVAGVKWVASFPRNIELDIPRASAVLVLNDMQTGFPFVCMEGSVISAARTAASAVLGAEIICQTRSATKVGFVGNGPIAWSIFELFVSLGWTFEELLLFDLIPSRAHAFRDRISARGGWRASVADDLEHLIAEVDLLVLATTAAVPYVFDTKLFAHKPRVLNISLRDLGPEIILSADNIVDDTEHCLRANTSLHLAEQRTGSRAFVTANVYECLAAPARWQPRPDRTAIFSPFGMGILDIAVGMHVYRVAARDGALTQIADFFPSAEGAGFPGRLDSQA